MKQQDERTELLEIIRDTLDEVCQELTDIVAFSKQLPDASVLIDSFNQDIHHIRQLQVQVEELLFRGRKRSLLAT